MTTPVTSQVLPPSLPRRQPPKSGRPARDVRQAGKGRPARELCRDLPLQPGVGSLERWLDLNA